MSRRRIAFVWLISSVVVSSTWLAACGSDQSKQTDTSKQLEDKPPPPSFEMSVPETEVVEAGPSDAGNPSESKTKARPLPKYENDREVKTTVGESGAQFRVGGATLRIPEHALTRGINVSLSVGAGGKVAGRVGGMWVVGRGVKSHGPPFELVLPVGADVGAVKLVIQRKWKPKKAKEYQKLILEPKSVDATQGALFEIPFLYKGEYWLTTEPKPATPAPAPSASAAPAPAPATSGSPAP